MPTINITVAEKIATNTTPGVAIVCGNSDYSVNFTFDSEWEPGTVRTARFMYYKNGQAMHQDVIFNGDTVAVPVLSNIDFVYVGVYAGDLRTTTPAKVLCDRSILCGSSAHEEPPEDVYNQFMAMLASGDLRGPQGEKGERGYGIGISVKEYGATGDGVTDYTAAFQTALTENRVVFVPGGTYKLSGTLVIRENCCLELSQDTILQFTQTSGNCIEMRGSAVLRGNHGIISVPYEFTGNAISLDTSLDGNTHNSIPPYAKADPMYKRQRFVYDVNIIKPTADGFHRTADGTCNGTAIYMYAYNDPNSTTDIPWMWAIAMSGVRIAGGFSYGIRAKNVDDPNGYTDNAWNHDMRIEAVIEACEIGVALENCNGAHLQVTVQPCQAVNKAKYAKHGVYLNDSRYVDMIGSRVWDWNADNSLWTPGGEYQHIAMIGNCSGLVLDDFLCYETSADIRDLIYTDTQSNFDKMSVLQEPGNKHFKSVDGVPYFNDGTANRKLMLASEKITAEQTDFIHPADGYYTHTPNFANLVNGYTDGYFIDGNGNNSAHSGYVSTDFIPIDGGNSHTYRIGGDGITWDDSYGYCRIAWYDSNKALKGSVMSWEKIGSNQYYPVAVEDDTVAAAFSTNANVAPPNGAAYFRITAKGGGANLIVTVDEKQEYDAIWHGEPRKLDETIHAVNDWNVSEGEVGHVKNRTHFSEQSVLFPETQIPYEDGIYIIPGVALTSGRTYTIVFDGVSYPCKVSNPEDVYGDGEFAAWFGNGGLYGVDGYEDTGEPFLAVLMDGNIGMMLQDTERTSDITVEIIGEKFHPLSYDFLPMLSYTLHVSSEEFTVSGDSFDANLTMDTTEIVNAIKKGLPMWLCVQSAQYERRMPVLTCYTPYPNFNEFVAGGYEAIAMLHLYCYDYMNNKKYVVDIND